ncbi:Scr1 family TA system antitoxin-like transcriptional regulator [Streptomyces agglomeratus]|uniref:Scr1 family TA system antitoxin-like transcriptional regulator n=1 Tax=Streptomyces agglomeratus TaxID=285458 RepID=UPI00114C9E14|nr:Scr1 family TA system antitoxin-like transcriptional regulator [Streptomyces agglomeratus]
MQHLDGNPAMLQVISPPPPTELPQAPARIVLGVYLRGLRKAKGESLEAAARVAGQSVSAVSRWERAESPISPSALQNLLFHYGVQGPHAGFLLRSLPPQDYTRSEHKEQGYAARVPFDHWADVAGEEATARYIAVMRTASEFIQFSMQVPAGLRTQAYQQAVLNPAVCLRPDEPLLGLPRWVHGIRWAEGQQRTVVLDEIVLTKPVGGLKVMAGQLRHLADLVSREGSDPEGLVIRILPMSPVLFIHTVHWPAEVTLHGHRLVTTFGLFPSYETGSRAARTVSAGLREALSAACGREETYELLVRAADAMERRATS